MSTDIKTAVDETVDEVIGIVTNSASGHFACCVSNPPKFICGAPYHPECLQHEEDEYGNCKKCKRIREAWVCPVGHHHCPILSGRICPTKGS
jgi:hypothetical protein